MQEHELRGRRRKESHHDDGGRHTGLGIKLERLNNAYGDGTEDDYAGEDRGQDDDEHEPGEEESRHKTVEGAAGQLEALQGQPLGQPRLFHAFANDDRREAQPREHGSPRPEYDFGIRYAAKDIGEREHRRHADGGEYIERPRYDGGAGNSHV